MEKLRRDAETIFKACIKAADASTAVKRFVKVQDGFLSVGPDICINLEDIKRIVVVGAGKAGASMAAALEEILPAQICGSLVVVKYGHTVPTQRIRVVEAGHPLPDEAGVRATREITDIIKECGDGDLVVSCISGGGSALLPGPAAPVTLSDKQVMTDLLIGSGAKIQEINTVRKHLSDIKGGLLMRYAFPAKVINLILSDVIGDDPKDIASGPFAPDPSTFSDCRGILKKYKLEDRAPGSIIKRLISGTNGEILETPKPGDPVFERAHNIIIGSNFLSLCAGRDKAHELGYNTLILSSTIEGDTSQAASFHAAVAKEVRITGNPVEPPACLLSGGETTVFVNGPGRGGRNQHFVLSLIESIARIPGLLVLSGGSDGTDGPTPAAGAFADSTSMNRAAEAGLDPAEFLEKCDSYSFFEKLGDLMITGPTKTNVMDIRIILLEASVHFDE